MRFTEVSFPNIGIHATVPQDIELQPATASALPVDQQHFLISIPWHERYLSYVPEQFQPFFLSVLPLLHVRTTDVHVAVCLRHADQLFERFSPTSLRTRLVIIAFILHDAGWSELSELEIAQSLGVTGVALTQSALGPKEKHAVESEKIARQVLASSSFTPPLTPAEVELICKAVRYHDKPEAVAGAGSAMPLEVQVLVDLDHLWSYTHENFWQDTVRKGVEPTTYLANLRADLPSYFVTDQGKALAQEFWAARAQEVALLSNDSTAS